MIILALLLIAALITVSWYAFTARLVLLVIRLDLADTQARLHAARTAAGRDRSAIRHLRRLALRLGAAQQQLDQATSSDPTFAEIIRAEFPQEHL